MNSIYLPVVALASGSTTATSALSDATKAVIQSGFETMTATVTDVIGIAVVASVGVICLTAGVNFALKKIRGVMSKAS